MVAIADSAETLEQLWSELGDAGFEMADLIIAVDFTASNPRSRECGNFFYNPPKGCPPTPSHTHPNAGHSLDPDADNPYRRAMTLIAKNMPNFDGDNKYEVFGFGSNAPETTDRALFSFRAGGQPCEGLEPAPLPGGGGGGGGGSIGGGGRTLLECYARISPRVKLGGPTTFAPIIRHACEVVRRKGCDYHILLILTDGAITRPDSTPAGEASQWERDTAEAIAYARAFPLSIVAVGVGPGPWDLMRNFDDHIHQAGQRDNFQFCWLEECERNNGARPPGELFVVSALNELPRQFVQGRALKGAAPQGPPVSVLDPPA